MQFAISDAAFRLVRIVRLPQDRDGIAAIGKVTVEA